MTSYWTYMTVQFLLPPIFAILTTIGVIVIGCCVLKQDKLVRIIFPYIKKKNQNTIMFGFILSRGYICLLFAIILLIVFITVLIFWIHLFVETSHTYNQKFDCFFDNKTRVEFSPEEAMAMDNISCYTWNFNIIQALGQATETIAIAWIFVSTVTWVMLKLSHKVKKRIKNAKNRKERLVGYFGYFIMAIIQVTIYIVPIVMIITATTSFTYNEISDIEIPLFGVILVSSGTVFWCTCFIKKEPESLEECCRKAMNMSQNENMKMSQEDQKVLLIEMAEFECKILIASKANSYISEEERRTIAEIAYNNIRKKMVKIKVTNNNTATTAIKDKPTGQNSTPISSLTTPLLGQGLGI